MGLCSCTPSILPLQMSHWMAKADVVDQDQTAHYVQSDLESSPSADGH